MTHTQQLNPPRNGPGPVHDQLMRTDTSSLRKYQSIFVGSTSLLDAMRYEAITFCFGNTSGALGLVARKLAFPRLFSTCGPECTFGRSITIRHPSKIRIGQCLVIDDLCVLDARGNQNRGIAIGDDVMIARNSALVCKDGDLAIGDRVGIGTNCLFHAIGQSHLSIGNDVAIGSYCYCVGGGEYITDQIDRPVSHQGQVSRGGITIEDNVWLGARVTVLDGVTIGRDAIVGAGSVVTNDIPPYSLAIGSPARVIRDRRESESL